MTSLQRANLIAYRLVRVSGCNEKTSLTKLDDDMILGHRVCNQTRLVGHIGSYNVATSETLRQPVVSVIADDGERDKIILHNGRMQ